jgi:hypothetical protein
MNKTININPELFKISSTRKRSTTPKNLSINLPKENNNKTISKRNTLLKFIRRHQDNNIKQTIDNSNGSAQDIDSDFENSLQYLMDISDSSTKNSDLSHENVNLDYPESISTSIIKPQYGCLKNGTLPTYRQFYNRHTLKNHTGMGKRDNTESINTNSLGKQNIIESFDTSSKIECQEPDIESIDNTENGNDVIDTGMQRKLLKRTYKVGKSNAESKISVLVSNKTIRHNASNKSITLKKTPIIDVKRYLVKQGLLKVGSSAPPDVLRKMYESASMICGDITNHNPETLMYNYMNSTKKTW